MKESATYASKGDGPKSEANIADPQPLSRLLRMAVMAGVESAVQVHIDRGDDLDARDGNGMTSLMLSAVRNRAVICKLLLDAGANGSLLDPSGQTAHAIALAAGAHEAAAVLEVIQTLPLHPSFENIPPVPVSLCCTDIHPISACVPPGSEAFSVLATTEMLLSEAPIMEASSATVDLGEVSEFDLSEWEAEEEVPPPEVDMSVVGAASATQIAISNHEATDSSAEWDDIDAYLPEQASPLVRADDAETRARMRLLLLRAIREGSVPSMEVGDLTVADDRSTHRETERLLIMVVNDLGAEVDERFEYTTANESFEVFIKPDETPSEEDTLDEAFVALDSAASLRNEPLRMYLREFQRLRLISANEEVELGQAMESALEAALDALAAWQQGIELTLNAGAEVKMGLRPLVWMSLGGAGSDIEPAVEADGGTPTALAEDDQNDLEGDDDSPVELRPQFFDHTFAEALSQLGTLSVSSNQHGAARSAVRDALVALRLNRGFLLKLADTEGAASSDAGTRYIQVMIVYQQARERMMAANLKLVFHLAKKYQYSGEPLDDLVQEGNIGLLKAIERYDWRRGFKFSTYATWWIRQQIGRYVADKSRTIRIPVHVYERLQRLQRETRVFASTFGRAPALDEIAASMEMSAQRVAVLQRLVPDVLPIHEVSIDELIAIEAREGFVLPSPEDIVDMTQLGRSIDSLLAMLTPKEEQILRMRFGIGIPDSLTLEEIGRCYEVTRERIRQIEAKAVRKLRHPDKGGAFARMALGVSSSAEKSKAADENQDGARKGTIDNADEHKGCLPEALHEPIPEAHISPTINSSRLDQLLASALALGVAVDDDRESQSGRVWVKLVVTSDAPQRILARKLIDFGFKPWPGKGYWI